ncbi:MAG: hypothetical protein KC635_28710 [Myxococcales bacterium]|nr:hypothetical protein [Myxococcales bacterium]MCB9732382.1 hypothetical protein [Deltaproteobacteria bacterium]
MASRTTRIILAALALGAALAASACTTSARREGNPRIRSADAGCFTDAGFDYWYFEADVTDPNGYLDVVAVDVHIYDERAGGELVTQFGLNPTEDPAIWYAEVPDQQQGLDCFYNGFSVDFVAYDSLDLDDAVTIVPATY